MRIERKIEDVLGENKFGIRRGKGNKQAIGMPIIVSEPTLDIHEELFAFFVD